MNDAVDNPAGPEDNTPAAHDAGLPGEQSVGTLLRTQREACGWNIEQVASQLNLAPRQILALEQDNYAALPGIAVARGFIRAYAKLLRIDPATVISMIPAETVRTVESLPSRPSLATPFSHGAGLPSLNGGSPVSKAALVFIALGALAAAAFAALQFGWIPAASLPFSMPQMPAAMQQEKVPDAGPGGELPQSGPDGAPGAEAGTPPAEAAVAADNQPPAAPAAAEPAMPDVAAAAAAGDPALAGKDVLVLTMHEDSWIEARRVGNGDENAPQDGGKILISRLARAGTSETIDVSTPVALTVGNVNGVQATLRGAAFDLGAGARNNIARINVK